MGQDPTDERDGPYETLDADEAHEVAGIPAMVAGAEEVLS
jgi:hypothetical protein